jgi:hypothetical protein
MTETVINPPPRRRRSSWATTFAAAALVLSAVNLAVDTGPSVGADEAGQLITVKSSARKCQVDIRKGNDCAVIERGAVTKPALAPNSVDTTKITPNGVTVTDLAPKTVIASKLGDDSVTRDKIGDNAVGSSQIAPGAVNSSEVGQLTLPDIQGLMPTVSGVFTGTDLSVVSPRVIGQPDPGQPATHAAGLTFTSFSQSGADWRCTTSGGFPCLRAPAAGTYLMSMKVSWDSLAGSPSSSRIAFVFVPDETGLTNANTVVAASGGGGVLASALPASSDGKQTQAFSQLVTLEEGQEIMLIVDYHDVMQLPPNSLGFTGEISLVLQ